MQRLNDSRSKGPLGVEFHRINCEPAISGDNPLNLSIPPEGCSVDGWDLHFITDLNFCDIK